MLHGPLNVKIYVKLNSAQVGVQAGSSENWKREASFTAKRQ